MSISLYDASVGTYIQMVGALTRVLKKSQDHFQKSGVDPDGLLHEKIAGDMLPLHFQIASVRHHSLGAVNAIVEGRPFTPPAGLPDATFGECIELLQKTRTELEAVSADAVNGASGKTVLFKVGGMELKFTAENFILSMELPNFYFHTTTAYDILRMKGAPIGKMDFVGKVKLSSV